MIVRFPNIHQWGEIDPHRCREFGRLMFFWALKAFLSQNYRYHLWPTSFFDGKGQDSSWRGNSMRWSVGWGILWKVQRVFKKSIIQEVLCENRRLLDLSHAVKSYIRSIYIIKYNCMICRGVLLQLCVDFVLSECLDCSWLANVNK